MAARHRGAAQAASKAEVRPRPEDAAIEALARALAPRVAELLRASQAGGADDFSDVLAGTGYEIDQEAKP